jgi:hypothetical protein
MYQVHTTMGSALVEFLPDRKVTSLASPELPINW